MLIEIKDEQSANAISPISTTLLGISMDVKEEQDSNTRFPIYLTVLGITIDLSLFINWKAPPTILVVPCLISTEISVGASS